MYTVMIVDDEALVRIGLQSLIDWREHGYVLQGVYKSGEEALEAASACRYDIILTDIRMPGMDGLELIRRLKEAGCDSAFVILSSYNDFEYTRRAIQLGVQDYISKYELEPDELIRVLHSLRKPQFPGARKPDAEEHPPLSEQKADILRLTRKRTEPPRDDAYGSDVTGFLRGPGAYRRWIVIQPLVPAEQYLYTEQNAVRLLVQELFERRQSLEFLGYDEDALHGLFSSPDASEDTAAYKALLDTLNEAVRTVSVNLNIPLAVGVSTAAEKDALQDCREGAAEAAKLSFYSGSGVYCYDSAGHRLPLRLFTEEEWATTYRLVRRQVQLEQFDELIAWLRSFGASHSMIRPSEWVRLGAMTTSHLTDLFFERYHAGAGEMEERFGPLFPFAEELGRKVSMQAYLTTMEQIIDLFKQWSSARLTNLKWLVDARAYVEANYHLPIRLEDVAGRVHFHENYFSQSFRRQTGENFSDYLTSVRINKAVELLTTTSLSTEEIASRVGYVNANYFVKVFKKITGKTISEFKKG